MRASNTSCIGKSLHRTAAEMSKVIKIKEEFFCKKSVDKKSCYITKSNSVTNFLGKMTLITNQYNMYSLHWI